MADGQQAYDLSSVAQDPGFINASAQDKIAYLSAHDADFAKASPKDKAGYLNHILGYDKPTDIEKAGATPGRLEAGNQVAAKILSGVGLPTSLSDFPRWGSHLFGIAPDSKPFWDSFTQAASNPTQRSLVNAVPFIGPSAVAAADEPTLLGKAASLTGTLTGATLGGELRPGYKAAKAELADAVRTPTNELSPKVNALSRIGTLAGGPQLADAFLPKRPEPPNFRGGAYEPPVEPVLGPDTPTRSQFSLSRKIATEANPPAPPELGSPENPGFYAKLPTRMPKPSASAGPLTPTIIRPSTTGEPLFSGSEGRAATWTNQDVQRLAAQGNREAIQQAVRRGMQLPANSRYVMGDPDFSRTIYNPRESTTFTPEGTPIRNRNNPIAQNPSSRALIAPAGSPYAPVESPEIGSPYGPANVGVSGNGYSPTGGNSGPYSPTEPYSPVNPQEALDMSARLGRDVTPEQVPDIRRRLEAERNVETGLAGDRTDTAGNIREAHRAKLEKKGVR